MKIETDKMFSIEKCKNNPNKLYVFGENQIQQGGKSIGGGQAIIRGQKNSYGFCTLTSIGEFWFDDMYKTNIEQINFDISKLKQKSKLFDTLVFPYYGLGTGRALMQKRCPLTFIYLCHTLLQEFNYNNLENLKSEMY